MRQPAAQYEVEQHGRAQRRGHRRRPHAGEPLDGSQRCETGLSVTPKILLGAKLQILLFGFGFFPQLQR